MIGMVGVLVIFVMVFGGYIAAGGKLGIILKALPFEFMMIGGAAAGAFLISNDMSGVKHTIKDMGKVFKGPKWKHDDYKDLLCLLSNLSAWHAKTLLVWRSTSKLRQIRIYLPNTPKFFRTKKRLH